MTIQTLPVSKNQNITNTACDAQTVSGNESKRFLLVEIAFPELHFTALCWIHSSSNSSWMFHHRPDPRGWCNALITHTHSLWGIFASCMWRIWESTGCHFICWGSDFIAYSMWEDTNMIECQDRAIEAIVAVVAFFHVSDYPFSSVMCSFKCRF